MVERFPRLPLLLANCSLESRLLIREYQVRTRGISMASENNILCLCAVNSRYGEFSMLYTFPDIVSSLLSFELTLQTRRANGRLFVTIWTTKLRSFPWV